MCDLYWRLYERGIPVLRGPSTFAKIVCCPTLCECDVVVYISDIDHVDEKRCVWTIDDPTFIHRYIWIEGFPHVALEDLEKLEGGNREIIQCILEKLRSGLRAP